MDGFGGNCHLRKAVNDSNSYDLCQCLVELCEYPRFRGPKHIRCLKYRHYDHSYLLHHYGEDTIEMVMKNR